MKGNNYDYKLTALKPFKKLLINISYCLYTRFNMIIGSCTFSMSLKLLLGNHELKKKNRGKMTIMTVVKYMNIMNVGN